MKTRILFLTAAFALTFAATSCSKDDDGGNTSGNGQSIDPNTPVPDPEGTMTVNIRNGGETSVDGINGIIIDGGNNFCAANYYTRYFSDLGAMKGLGNITDPVTTGLTSKCAVIPGHGYWCYTNTKQFPSGKMAILDGSTHYKLYVDSWILGGTSSILGAVVKYVPYIYHAPYQTPDPEAELLVSSTLVAPTEDIEYIPNEKYQVTISGNTITWKKMYSGSYYLYIRVGVSYFSVR